MCDVYVHTKHVAMRCVFPCAQIYNCVLQIRMDVCCVYSMCMFQELLHTWDVASHIKMQQ